MAEPSVKKSVCERYDVRSGHSHDWAIIMLDQRGGILQIHSDYGDWSYSWPHHGRKTFKHFIVELGRDTTYLMGKLHGTPDEFDEEETRKLFKEHILEWRKEGCLTFAQSRAIWDAVEEASWSRAEDVWETVQEHPHVYNLVDDGPPCVTKWPGGLRCFIERIWPVFVAAIKKEVEEDDLIDTLAEDPNVPAKA